MRKFAEEYPQEIIGQQAVDKLPWEHIVVFIYSGLDKKQQKFVSVHGVNLANNKRFIQ